MPYGFTHLRDRHRALRDHEVGRRHSGAFRQGGALRDDIRINIPMECFTDAFALDGGVLDVSELHTVTCEPGLWPGGWSFLPPLRVGDIVSLFRRSDYRIPCGPSRLVCQAGFRLAPCRPAPGLPSRSEKVLLPPAINGISSAAARTCAALSRDWATTCSRPKS